MALNKIPQRAFDNDDFITDVYTATAGQTAFTMSRAAALNSILVHINDVLQQPTTDYTTSGTTLTLTSGATVGDDVRVRIMSERPLGTAGGGSGVTTLGGLNDVTTTGVSSGQVLKWNGTTWAPATDATGGGGSSLTIQDEGSALSTAATTLNFVGSGITASGTGATKTITVTGSGGSGIALSDLSVASEGTAAGNGSITYNNTNGQFTYTPPTLNGLSNAGDVDFGANKILYANVYATTGDLPSASSYHGMFAHVHGTGKGYYAHAGAWVELANNSQLNLDGLSDVSTSGVSSGQVLKYNGTSWAPAADASGSSGIALGDISVGSEGTASGDGSLAYNNSTGVFTYTPPVIPAVALPDDQEFGVTASGSSAYTFSGGATGNNPTITLQRGKTYRFDVNASGHPFQIRVSDGGSNYTNGVENAGTQSGAVYFTVPDDAPATLVYQCTNHAAMVGTINIIDKIVPGHMIQTVQRISTSHETINTSSWTATNVFASITPNSTSSKILVRMTGTIRTYNTSGQSARGAWRLYKDIGGGGYNRVGIHQFSHGSNDYGGSGSLNDVPYHVEYLDSPSTTSEVTYKLYGSHEVGTASEVGPDGDDEQYTILTEIAD
jgi:hypothetical protein